MKTDEVDLSPYSLSYSYMELVSEFKAKAMLLGMEYDEHDHTFYIDLVEGKSWPQLNVFDADTMEVLDYGATSNNHRYNDRKRDVAEGKFGPRKLAIQRQIEKDNAHVADHTD